MTFTSPVRPRSSAKLSPIPNELLPADESRPSMFDESATDAASDNVTESTDVASIPENWEAIKPDTTLLEVSIMVSADARASESPLWLVPLFDPNISV